MKNENIEKIREIFLKYLLPDCLKPEYDGMTTYELAEKIIEVIK